MECKHQDYVKAGRHNNKQYLKCKKCKKIFTLDTTDRRIKFKNEDFKKIYPFNENKTLETQYNEFLTKRFLVKQ